jgi:hypothetical protein
MPQNLPRRFQADLDRFYQKVICPTLSELPLHEDVKTGEFTSMDEFLDDAEKQTSNLLAYDARRCFALALAAIFERQLQLRLMQHSCKSEMEAITKMPFKKLLLTVARKNNVALTCIETIIDELHRLANVVRHGDGDSLKALRLCAPHLWPPHSIESTIQSLSEVILISDDNFVAYIRALTRFWGLADHESGAVVDPPPHF